jgi:hypothetical protein
MHVHSAVTTAKARDKLDIPLMGMIAMEGCMPKLRMTMHLGKRNVPCSVCGAKHWKGEASSDDQFRLCCSNGKTTEALDSVNEPLCPVEAPQAINELFQ